MNNDAQLRAFGEVSRAPSFSEAAARLHVSVSAVSQLMKALEQRLGVRLFERVGRRSCLTPEGKTLAERISGPLAELDAAVQEVAGNMRRIAGEVRLGAPRAFGRHWLSSRLPALLKQHPHVKPVVTFDVPSVLERQLAAAELDLAILARPSEMPGLTSRRLAVERFVAVASPQLINTNKPPATETDFRALPWIVFDGDSAMHAPWWRAYFGRTSVLPERVVCSIASVDEMLFFAQRAVGVAVVPDYLLVPNLAEHQLVELIPSSTPKRAPHNTLFLAWRTQAVDTGRLVATREALLVKAL